MVITFTISLAIERVTYPFINLRVTRDCSHTLGDVTVAVVYRLSKSIHIPTKFLFAIKIDIALR